VVVCIGDNHTPNGVEEIAHRYLEIEWSVWPYARSLYVSDIQALL